MKAFKPEKAIAEGRVKLHVFEPSGRHIWTVVGREDEYWMDPDSGYCSCQGYYFGDARTCYHIFCQDKAINLSKFETIRFADREFDGFIAGLVGDTMRGRASQPLTPAG